MQNELVRLGDVLEGAEGYSEDYDLYLPEGGRWDADTRSALLSTEELGEEPPFAKEHGLSYCVGMYTVQDIVANAREQLPDADVGKLLDAFLFYLDNDAFIDFTNSAPKGGGENLAG